MQVGLADVHITGRLEPGDRLGSAVRHMIGKEDRAIRGAHKGRVEQILNRQRDALTDPLRACQKDGRAATLTPSANTRTSGWRVLWGDGRLGCSGL